MSAAFCFLTVGDVTQPQMWQSFFSNPYGSGIFCHPKNPQEIATELLRSNIISERIATQHGDVSLVSASLSLLRAAFEHGDYQHFILLSETAIPIVPLSQVLTELRSLTSKSLINHSIAPPNSEHFNRQRSLPPQFRMTPFYSHDQWVVLSREHLRRLLEKDRTAWFKRMFAPDEHYFLNVMIHECQVAPGDVVNQRKTYVNWQDHEIREVRDPDGQILKRTVHPKTYHQLTHQEVRNARRDKHWFFRKVSSQCDCWELINFTRLNSALL